MVYEEKKGDEKDDDFINLKDNFNINSKINPNEAIKIIFKVPSLNKKLVKTLCGNIEIKVEDSDIEPILIKFKFNVILIPLEIYFISNNGELFWDDNKLVLKNNNFSENEIFGFKYEIRNFQESKSFLAKNFSLKSIGKNEVVKSPNVIQETDNINNYIIEIPSITKKQEYIEGLFNLYFTEKMYIPLVVSGKIKKTDFKIFYYNQIIGEIEEQKATLYLYKHKMKEKKSFDIELHFLIKILDHDEHEFQIKFPEIRYRDQEIGFSLKKDIKKKFKDYQLINIIASVGCYCDDYNYYIPFYIDGVYKRVTINAIKESKKIDKGGTKFINLPYKYNCKGKPTLIDKSDLIKFEKNKELIICYNPFCVKFYDPCPYGKKDIFFNPINKINIDVEKIDGINLVLFSADTKSWLPNLTDFGDDIFDDYEKKEEDEKYIEYAKEYICGLFNEIQNRTYYKFTRFLHRNYSYEDLTNINKEDLKKYVGLNNFIAWLVSKDEKIKIKKERLNSLAAKMEEEYQKILIPLFNTLAKETSKKKKNSRKEGKKKFFNEDDYENENELLPIKYYNILIELRKIIKERYKFLEKINFNITKLEMKNKKNFCKKFISQYFPPYNEKDFIKKVDNLCLVNFEEKKINGKTSKIWLFNENEEKPKPIYEPINLNDKYKNELKEYRGKNIDLNLDILKIKDLSKAQSLDDIISILKNGYSISQAFMFCIGKLENEQINSIFNYLYEIYITLRKSRKSILSIEIKNFVNAFETLCSSLKGSDVDLSKFSELDKLEKKRGLILNEEKPLPNTYPFKSGSFWKSSNTYIPSYKKKDEDFKTNISIEKEPIINPIQKNEEPNKIDNNKKRKITKNIIPENLKNIEFQTVKGRHYNLLDEGSDNEEEKGELVHLVSTDTVVKLKDEEINQLKTISDEGVTKSIIKRMLANKSKDFNLKFPENFPEFKSEIYGDRNKILEKFELKKEGEDYIDKPFYQLINEFSKNVYIKLFQQCYNFDKNEVCGIIGIDICRTIDKEHKLFHTIIATSMAHCFNSIEIPYAIVVFCDYGIQFIIKDFDEPHIEDISQLIFDAIMVPRSSTRIADACYFISQKVNCRNRINKRIFIISNGLDTKLKIGEKWSSIFSNEKEKFCFYFVKPKISDEEFNEIKKIWDDFKEKTKTEMAIISEEDILNLNHQLYLPFQNTMKSKVYKNLSQKNNNGKIEIEFLDVIKFKKEDYDKVINSISEDMINSEEYFVQNKFHNSSKEQYKVEDIPVKNAFKTIRCECLNEDYTLEKIDSDTKYAIEKLFSDQITSNMKSEYLEFVFAPNKPSMYSPSTKGTRLYLMGLINFCITHGQDNKIWLEKNKGLKKDYRVSVVIDTSISCFNDYMRPHSIKSVLAVLRMLSLVEIPYFDLIIATAKKPVVLCCGNDTLNSLNMKSYLWDIVLEQLTYNDEKCNLIDALKLVYKLKYINNVKKNYAFVLTDGMFDEGEREKIKDYVSFCEECNLEVFGIGIGYYPEGIKDLFNKCIWSINPFMILKALSNLFGNTEKQLDNLPSITFDKKNLADVISKFTTIIRKLYSYQKYKILYGFLDSLPLLMESLDEITNPDKADEIGVSNQEISETNTMCKKGEFEGFKILIGMFWSYELLPEKESEWIVKKYLLERYDPNKECLKEVLSYYSIEIEIIQDYKECIQELQTGDYYAHWVICGNGGGKLPKKDGNPNLVGQYIEAVKMFWINGGSVVFWNDNEPYTYECNLFLEKAEFPGEISKTKVRFGGDHDGKSVMIPGDINIGLEKDSDKGKFNHKRLFNDGKYPMFSLGHNLVRIAEGTTVSFAQDSEGIAPFNIFGYEHQGGKNILFYTPPFKYNHGYLVLEGGFTKLFNEIDSDGIKRYILNIASFTTQFAKRFGEIGENWKIDFKIPPFAINIDESVKWEFRENILESSDFDIVYVLDATGSMGNYLAAARDQCINISNQLKSELPQYDFQFGAVFYRDPIDCPGEENHVYTLKKDVNILKGELASETATGGGDGPEDWVGAYDFACNNIGWRNGTRLIIHIADAPAHGSEWCNENNHESENPKLYPMIQKCVEKKIKIIGFQIGSYPKPSFDRFGNEYKKRGGTLFLIKEFQTHMNAAQISQHFKDMVVESTKAAAPR